MTPYETLTFRSDDNDMSDTNLSDNDMSDVGMADNKLSDNYMSDNDMSESGISYTFSFAGIVLSQVPKTWLHYLNGPQAGTIDVELARQEMPWLAGIAQKWTYRLR